MSGLSYAEVKVIFEGCKIEHIGGGKSYGCNHYKYKVSPIPKLISEVGALDGATFHDGGIPPFGGRNFAKHVNQQENYVVFSGTIYTD